MDLVIGQSRKLRGKVEIPPNKSHSFRALIMAGLAEGTSRIVNPAESNDWMLCTEAFERFGASVRPRGSKVWEVEGTGGELETPDDVIFCGNSGIFMRFFTALSGLGRGYTVLTGDNSLRNIRPIKPLVDALNQLGAWAVCTRDGDFAPVVVRGPLKGGRAEMSGADSQPVSAMLFASTLAEGDTELVVTNPGEKPWIGVTLHWMEKMGVEFTNENYERYVIKQGSKWQGFEYRVPLDWSAALYPVVAAIAVPDSELVIPGMDPEDCQGDKEVLDVLREMGADIEVDDGRITVRTSELRGMEVDCNNFIDQLPLMAVVGALAEGETRLVNAAVCRQKECDRIAVSDELLTAMGADVEQTDDGLVIRGSKLKGTQLNSHHDHRMVMAMTIAGMAAEGETTINDCSCVKKTFARFPEQMASVGCDLRMIDRGAL
jgi:3-phosphoshikimate 1-carboxyvinyltransferase